MLYPDYPVVARRPDRRSRRELLGACSAVVAACAAGCVGRTSSLAANARLQSTAPPDHSLDSGHDVGLVCYNASDEATGVAVRVDPTDDSRPIERHFELSPAEAGEIEAVLHEPAPGSIPHVVTAETDAGDRARGRFVANASHDLHEIHVVVGGDGRVDVRGVSH